MTIKTTKNEKDWSIKYYDTNQDLVKLLDKNEYTMFSKAWKDTVQNNFYLSPFTTHRTLLINDALQVIYNSLVNPTLATIVDPLAYQALSEEVQELLDTRDVFTTTDTLGNKRSLMLIDDSFDEAYTDCLSKNKYDNIFIYARDEKDILPETIEKYYLMLEDYGFLFIELSSTVSFKTVSKTTLDHYFSILESKVRTPVTKNTHQFLTYRKIKGLV